MPSPEEELKQFPQDYPRDALAILDAMSFTDGKSVMLLGSMSIRSQQYAGDYDAFEICKGLSPNEIVSKWQTIIRRLKGMPDVYIGDIKAGEVDDWRILNKNAGVKNGKVVDYNSVECHKRIDALVKGRIITEAEGKEAMEMTPTTITPVGILTARTSLKYHIVRWTPADILAGEKVLRDGSVFPLSEAVQSNALCKMDCIGLVQNNRYTDFSMIYEFHYQRKILNEDFRNIGDALTEDIIAFTAQGKLFKVLKRVYALAKFRHQEGVIKKLTPILNSDLGRLYQVVSDVGTLIDLLDEKKPVPLSKIHFELDQFKGRLSNIYNLPDYLKSHHDIIGKLNAATKTSSRSALLTRLEALHKEMLSILNKNSPSAKGLSGGSYIHHLTDAVHSVFGSGARPDKNTLQQIASQSYRANSQPSVGNLTLLHQTPTLKFFLSPDKTIVVGIRGTVPTDINDVTADASIAAGQLETSNRFTKDLADLQQFQSKYPPSQYDYYGVGHSLGGAILDLFLTKGLLKSGLSYNPAIQPQNLRNADIQNDRVFAENDPLYAIAKPFLAKPAEVRRPRKKSFFENALSYVPYAGKAYDYYTGHQLSQFQGGKNVAKIRKGDVIELV